MPRYARRWTDLATLSERLDEVERLIRLQRQESHRAE
jgi:hypothetical protein